MEPKCGNCEYFVEARGECRYNVPANQDGWMTAYSDWCCAFLPAVADTSKWVSVSQSPSKDGEYLVHHYTMRDGVRARPLVDRRRFVDGQWDETEITHWKSIDYPVIQ